jgi:hypothetical protein
MDTPPSTTAVWISAVKEKDMKRIKDSTWNWIIAILMFIFLAYLNVSKAQELDASNLTEVQQMEILIATCAAANAVAAQELENDGYLKEATRWFQFYIGWSDYNEGQARERVKFLVTRIYENQEAGQDISAITKITDDTCIGFRDFVLKLTNMSIEEWFAE